MGPAFVRRLKFAVVIAGFAAPLTLAAQAPVQGPVFRSATQIVRVDAVVLDKDGRPVRGLTKDDFEILDKKTLRPVETLEELAYDRAPADLDAPLPSRLTSSDNRDAVNDRRVILVVDEPRVMISRTNQARDVARRIVRALGGRVQMALIRTNGELACEFTKDARLLLDALDDVRGEKTYFDYATFGWEGFASPSYPAGRAPGELAPTRMLPNLRDRGVFNVLMGAANSLSYDNGRRTAIVLVSEGQPSIPMTPVDWSNRLNTGGFWDRAELHWMVASARSANVAVYAIDPRGKAQRGQEGYAYGAWLRTLNDDVATSSQESLRDLTALTGGWAFVNSDDFEGGANRILDELDHYYLLGFSPADPNSKAARQITVRVKRAGLTVRHRQFFSSAPPRVPKFPKNPTPHDWLQSLVAGVTPAPGLPVRITAVASAPTSDKSGRVTITANADAPAGQTVDLGLWAVDISNGRVSKAAGLPLFFDGATARHELVLPPGRYQFRLAARARDSGQGGSAYLTVDVPKR